MHGVHLKKTLNMSSFELPRGLNELAQRATDLERLSGEYPVLSDKELRAPIDSQDTNRVRDYLCEILPNKENGLRREVEVEASLQKKYPRIDNCKIVREAYLRDENGNIVKDPVSNTARRIDFVVIKDGCVVEAVEVTSPTADKTEQLAKESRIRENGGNYIRIENGELVRLPSDVHTKIERRA
jgi:hypothetical protein